MADVLLKRQLSLAGHDATIQSAGTDALIVIGHAADAPACSLMQSRGLDISAHRACQVNQEATRWAELILVMQNHHLAHILALDPTARGKTFLLGHWTSQEIADPYQRGEALYGQVLALIDSALEAWVNKIVPTR